MKKILLFLAVCALCFSLTSCGGLESRAKKQMRETMEELAKAPDDMKIILYALFISSLRVRMVLEDGIHHVLSMSMSESRMK